MSDKTLEERELDKSNELAQKMILGEVTPDLVQSYRIIKNCIDSAILKGIYTAGDNALLVRAFDTLRNHINEFTNVETSTETETEVVVEETETEEVVAEEKPKKETKKEVAKKPARKKR